MSALAGEEAEMVSAIADWIEQGKPRGPFFLHLSPTMACNLNCLFCRRKDQMRGYYQNHREIPNERYLTMVQDALDMGVKAVTIKGGGEPLLRRSLMLKLVPLIKSRGVRGDLVTNGTHLNEEMRQTLVGCGWDRITISLDGSDAKTHDFLRDAPGTFALVLQALERLARLKKQRSARAPSVVFHCVLTNQNFAGLGAMIELAHQRGVERVELDSLSVRFDSNRELLMSDEDVKKFKALLPAWIAALKRRGLSHNFEQFASSEYIRRDKPGEDFYSGATRDGRSPAAFIPCYYPWYQASITPAGDLVPCCYAEEGHSSRANLNEVSFRQAWLEKDGQDYRAGMQSGAMMPFCRNCTAMYADHNNRLRRWLKERAHARA